VIVSGEALDQTVSGITSLLSKVHKELKIVKEVKTPATLASNNFIV